VERRARKKVPARLLSVEPPPLPSMSTATTSEKKNVLRSSLPSLVQILSSSNSTEDVQSLPGLDEFQRMKLGKEKKNDDVFLSR